MSRSFITTGRKARNISPSIRFKMKAEIDDYDRTLTEGNTNFAINPNLDKYPKQKIETLPNDHSDAHITEFDPPPASFTTQSRGRSKQGVRSLDPLLSKRSKHLPTSRTYSKKRSSRYGYKKLYKNTFEHLYSNKTFDDTAQSGA